MLKIALKYLPAVTVLILSITLASCDKNKSDTVTAPVVTDQNTVNYVPTDDEATLQARNTVDGIINNSLVSVTNLGKISTAASQSGGGLKKTNDLIGEIKYIYECGYYVWSGSFIDSDYPTAFKGTIYAKLQFKGSDGKVCDNPMKAASMYSYLKVTGAFGFVDPEPQYGDKSTQILEGTWTYLKVAPNFHGTGSYQRCWSGVWNDKDVTLSTTAKIQVDHLQLFIDNTGVLPLGIFYVYVDCYKACAVANGTNIITVNVYKNNTFLKTFTVDCGQRLKDLAYVLNLMN